MVVGDHLPRALGYLNNGARGIEIDRTTRCDECRCPGI